MRDPGPSVVLRDVVLIGGGHSHVGVLRHFAMHPVAGVRVTLVSSDTDTPYSGMLPGYVAGHYGFDDVHIDLARLAKFAGARFIHARAVGLERDGKRVLLQDRPPLAYDIVSINIGSTPQVGLVPGAAEHAVPVKPIHRFNRRWLALTERVCRHAGRTTIAVVGGGAGGVELTLAMQHRLRQLLQQQGRDPDELQFHLLTADDTILPTHNRSVRRRFESVLQRRAVVLHTGAAVRQVDEGRLRTEAGTELAADEIVWVTQAGGAAWLRETGLALDERGFIRVDDTLRAIGDPAVFAAGDVASIDNHALEKAGVFAVRMARPLAQNIERSLAGRALRVYRPQRRWLALISTGDRYAVASRGGALSLAGAWVWRWKDWIDRRFMRRFNDLPAMEASPDVSPAAARAVAPPRAAGDVRLSDDEALQALSAAAMRCGGCGAKVGAAVLSRALAGLPAARHGDVLIGLDAPDDAAVVRVPAGKALVHSVDFFRAFTDDAYLFGRIAANHALGDLFAMGATPHSATAIATVPPGLERQVEQQLAQMMAGAVDVLNTAGCALVGGHSGEGRELALGFAVNGLVDADLGGVLRKGGMCAGDVLVLTKPLGTGCLLAAHERLFARGRWVEAAFASMVLSNHDAAQLLRAHGATACTDVTGFGLLGHLAEMTAASNMAVTLVLSRLPLLDGARDCVAAGIFSSLQPANVRLRRMVRDPERFAGDTRYPLLFDPQTAGGLLASVPAAHADACVAALRTAGYTDAAAIGHVETPPSDASALQTPVTLTD